MRVIITEYTEYINVVLHFVAEAVHKLDAPCAGVICVTCPCSLFQINSNHDGLS